MNEANEYIERRISYYKNEIKELLLDYINEKDESRKNDILRVRMGYEITLSEIEKIKTLI